MLNLEFLDKEDADIKSMVFNWLSSSEFKIYSVLEFPPLINPNTVDYFNIDAKLAWKLNLPLPQFYKFVYWGSHGAGNTGFGVFLNKYDCINFYSANDINGESAYISLFNTIISHKKQDRDGYLAIRNYIQNRDGKKFHSLIYSNKSVNLVRDPISTLKHYVGMRRFYNKKIRVFNIFDNLDYIFDNLVGYGYDKNIYKDIDMRKSIIFWMNYRYKTFHDTQLIKELINVKNTIYIDMQEIIADRAFDTMQNLATFCNMKQVDKTNKDFFKEQISKYEGVLPLVVKMDSINIFITTKYWVYINSELSYETKNRYTDVIIPKDIVDITNLFVNDIDDIILICIDKDDYDVFLK
ncbi:DUF2972 domain-containing protein, partial [Campylobacter jejuni]|nr:DUF2972 domain-containing protein [Campylobacter jejuni]